MPDGFNGRLRGRGAKKLQAGIVVIHILLAEEKSVTLHGLVQVRRAPKDEIVQAYDSLPQSKQALDQMAADKSGCTCHEAASGSHEKAFGTRGCDRPGESHETGCGRFHRSPVTDQADRGMPQTSAVRKRYSRRHRP